MTPQTPPPLFRVQALKHSSGASHGKVLLARPLSFTVLTALFVGIAIAVVLFFACFSFTRKAQVAGVILPAHGVVRIASAQAGVVPMLRHSNSSNGIVDVHADPAAADAFVPAQRVDFLLAGLDRLDVIKIDIEGHEQTHRNF